MEGTEYAEDNSAGRGEVGRRLRLKREAGATSTTEKSDASQRLHSVVMRPVEAIQEQTIGVGCEPMRRHIGISFNPLFEKSAPRKTIRVLFNRNHYSVCSSLTSP